MSIITQLYSGELCPVQDINPQNAEFKDASAKYQQLRERIWKLIGEENRMLWDDLEEQQSVMTSAYQEEAFKCGFQTATQLFCEGLGK